MDRNDCRFLSVHFFIYRYHPVAKRRFLSVFPRRISTLDRVLAAKEFCEILDLVRQCISCCFHGASYSGACKEFILIQLHNSDIGRSLYQSLDTSAHLLDTKRNFHQVEENFFSAGRMKDHRLLHITFCDLDRDA